MKREFAVMALVTALVATVGCKKEEQQDLGAIRDGIQQHLASLKTLNLSAMEMKVSNLSVNGKTAEAQVEFAPKTGAPAGAAMRVSYSLEKRGEHWIVVKTNALGGAIEHPAASANPHTQAMPGEVHGRLPNFRDVLPPADANTKPTPPPGHPDVPPADPPPQ